MPYKITYDKKDKTFEIRNNGRFVTGGFENMADAEMVLEGILDEADFSEGRESRLTTILSCD